MNIMLIAKYFTGNAEKTAGFDEWYYCDGSKIVVQLVTYSVDHETTCEFKQVPRILRHTEFCGDVRDQSEMHLIWHLITHEYQSQESMFQKTPYAHSSNLN